MKYTIYFLKKNGKVKGKVGCNTLDTVYYLVDTWQIEPLQAHLNRQSS